MKSALQDWLKSLSARWLAALFLLDVLATFVNLVILDPIPFLDEGFLAWFTYQTGLEVVSRRRKPREIPE